MAASRKLYREMAESARQALSYSENPEAGAQIVRAFASDLKRDNPHFRYDRFYEAAGLDDNGYPKESE